VGTKINASVLDAIGLHGVGRKFIKDEKKAKDKSQALKAEQLSKSKQETEARLASLGAQSKGAGIKGQGGDGSLLTGAGGVKDPALTGKSTLLGS
jgi:hypothetical protein